MLSKKYGISNIFFYFLIHSVKSRIQNKYNNSKNKKKYEICYLYKVIDNNEIHILFNLIELEKNLIFSKS